MRKIFISYAREDLETARRLYVDLKRLGANPWLDQEDLLPGQKWGRVIRRTIRESSHFLAIISRHSVNKRGFVQKELHQALEILEEIPPNQIFIIPCRIDDSKPTSERLAEFQWVDLFPFYGDGLSRVAQSLGLATVFNAKSDHTGAEEIYRKILQEQLGSLAATMNSLAATLMHKGEGLDEAEDLFKEALDIRREIFGHDHPDTAVMVNNLGLLFHRRGKYSVAERLFKESLSTFEQALGENNSYTAFTKYCLARLYRSIDDPEQARTWLIESLKIYHKVLGEDHPEVAAIMANMKDLLEPAD